MIRRFVADDFAKMLGHQHDCCRDFTFANRINLVRRDLKCEFSDPNSAQFIAREKGIDVSLAVALVEGAVRCCSV